MRSERTSHGIGRNAAALAVAVLLLGVGPVLAQSGPSTPGATGAKVDPLCASYGPGFARLAGSSTCVKITSSIQSDATGTDISRTTRVDPLAPALKSK